MQTNRLMGYTIACRLTGVGIMLLTRLSRQEVRITMRCNLKRRQAAVVRAPKISAQAGSPGGAWTRTRPLATAVSTATLDSHLVGHLDKYVVQKKSVEADCKSR